MSLATIAAVADAQRGLAAALDAGKIERLEEATATLLRAVQQVRAAGAWHPTPELKTLIRRAIAEGEAARVRTRYLADHARVRLDRVQALTGRGTARYGRSGRYL